ncbi:MAG: hypothetical protein GAK45_02291 [Pseudomonas citronellolis]|nr:MAG: hypothetical protein GAK45_02291 [Pseudomonas citronellolis]
MSIRGSAFTAVVPLVKNSSGEANWPTAILTAELWLRVVRRLGEQLKVSGAAGLRRVLASATSRPMSRCSLPGTRTISLTVQGTPSRQSTDCTVAARFRLSRLLITLVSGAARSSTALTRPKMPSSKGRSREIIARTWAVCTRSSSVRGSPTEEICCGSMTFRRTRPLTRPSTLSGRSTLAALSLAASWITPCTSCSNWMLASRPAWAVPFWMSRISPRRTSVLLPAPRATLPRLVTTSSAAPLCCNTLTAACSSWVAVALALSNCL